MKSTHTDGRYTTFNNNPCDTGSLVYPRLIVIMITITIIRHCTCAGNGHYTCNCIKRGNNLSSVFAAIINFGGVLRKCRCWHEGKQHGQREKGAQQTDFSCFHVVDLAFQIYLFFANHSCLQYTASARGSASVHLDTFCTESSKKASHRTLKPPCKMGRRSKSLPFGRR